MNFFAHSVERAAKYLGPIADSDAYVILKLSPVPFTCCHFRHWPETWRAVNTWLGPQGPIAEEGDVLIEKGDARYVLEGHESGPEIVLVLGLAAASAALAKSVVELITTIAKSMARDEGGASRRLRITRRRVLRGREEQEVVTELDLPISDDTAKALDKEVRAAIRRHIEKE